VLNFGAFEVRRDDENDLFTNTSAWKIIGFTFIKPLDRMGTETSSASSGFPGWLEDIIEFTGRNDMQASRNNRDL
jgi:hypothetical protein